MKKISLTLSFLFLLVGLFGCQQSNDEELVHEMPNIEKIGTQAEVSEGDFVYRLVTEKAEYSDTEPIKVYAELEYIGDKEKITISHAASPFYFPMTETTRNYEIGYGMDQPALKTVIIKGEPLRAEYKGSGGYSSDDKEKYKDFIEQIMNQQFPKGHYVVKGFADFWVEESDEIEKDYKIEAQIEFSVSKK